MQSNALASYSNALRLHYLADILEILLSITHAEVYRFSYRIIHGIYMKFIYLPVI